MRTIKKLLLLALVAGLFLAVAGLNPAYGGVYRDLQQRGIPFTVDGLLNHAQNGNLEMVAMFLDGGMNINVRNAEGTTALCAAAMNGHPELVQFLAAAGADLNIRNHQGLTAVDLARKDGAEKMVSLLLRLGAWQYVHPEGWDPETSL